MNAREDGFMKVGELASRYAKAAFDLAVESGAQDQVQADLRAIDDLFSKDPQIIAFLTSPMVSPEDKEAMVQKAFAATGASPVVVQLLMTLARKDRFSVFSQVVHSFQDKADAANGVGRGIVRSAVALGPQDRQQIESIVEKVLKKKVILTYKTDPSVIGGLVAQVGSYTFDDSIDSHLKRMNEELKRRTV